MVDVATLIQYLYEGDILGLLQAIYVAAFQSVDVFYGVVTLLVLSAIYIRTKSLLLMIILWTLLGTIFIAAMPLVSGLGVFLWILAVGATLWKVYLSVRD